MNYYIAPLDATMRFDHITLLAFEDNNTLPMFSLSFHSFNVKYTRNEELVTNIKVTSKHVNASYFENNIEQNILIERKMMGKLDQTNKYELGSNTLDLILKEFYKTAISVKQSMNEDNDLVVEMYSSFTDKSKRIIFNNPRIYLQTLTYYYLGKFISVDPSIYPPPPKPKMSNYGKNILKAY